MGVALSSDNTFFLVCDMGDQTVKRVDTTTNTVTQTYKTSKTDFSYPHSVAISPDDEFALLHRSG